MLDSGSRTASCVRLVVCSCYQHCSSLLVLLPLMAFSSLIILYLDVAFFIFHLHRIYRDSGDWVCSVNLINKTCGVSPQIHLIVIILFYSLAWNLVYSVCRQTLHSDLPHKVCDFFRCFSVCFILDVSVVTFCCRVPILSMKNSTGLL